VRLVTTIALKRVGSVELTDWIGMCAGQGDGIPYPLWRTRRDPYWGVVEQGLPPFAERFHGELGPLQEWAETYARADIWVECRVRAFASDLNDIRLVAHRMGEAGFVATQRPIGDVVDVYRLSTLDIGAAVADRADLVRPGTRPSIAIAGFLDNFIGTGIGPDSLSVDDSGEEDDYGFSVRHIEPTRSDSVRISCDDVLLLATVQSHCDPLQIRGVDWGRDVAAWVRVKGDGDYIYAAGRDRLVPVNSQTLRGKVDELIAADVRTLRKRRGLV
jgi:hypothetical protein